MNTVQIVGPGVMGSTLALRLRELGRQVRVTADPDPQDAAGFGGVGIMEDQEPVAPASGPLQGLDMKEVNDQGVRAWAQKIAEPGWRDIGSRKTVTYYYEDPNRDTSGFLGASLPEQNPRVIPYAEIPAHLQAAGYQIGTRFETTILDTAAAMEQLHAQMRAANVEFHSAQLRSYDSLPKSDIIVDTTGIGRRRFFGDERVYPKRGQTLVLKGEHDLDEVIGAPGSPISYNVVPLNGTTLLIGATKENDLYDPRPHADIRQAFLREGAKLYPKLASLSLVPEDRVRHRPMAASLIVEVVEVDGRLVLIVNGLGGGGWSLCLALVEHICKLILSLMRS